MSQDPKFASTVRNLGHSAMEHAPAAILSVEDLLPSPFDQFEKWLKAAIERGLKQPLGMTLATVDAEGRPHARIVLLRGFGPQGFEFHTNYNSPKAEQMGANSNAALVFWWTEMERQVRIEGSVAQVSPEDSDTYWMERPRLSRLAALSSRQSSVIKDRAELDERVRALERQYEGQEIPRPANWGGFRLAPNRFEFWQEGPNRLHDRFVYRTDDAGAWTRERLSP